MPSSASASFGSRKFHSRDRFSHLEASPTSNEGKKRRSLCFKQDQDRVIWFKNRLVVPKDREYRNGFEMKPPHSRFWIKKSALLKDV